MIAPQGLSIGDLVHSGRKVAPSLGSSLFLREIPLGAHVYNVSYKEHGYGQLSRSAGTFAVVKRNLDERVSLVLPSGEIKQIPQKCSAVIGEVSNEFFFLQQISKAGRARWLNQRPIVRGVAMNPIDHPHGGGEGKKSGKLKTPWGKHNGRKTASK